MLTSVKLNNKHAILPSNGKVVITHEIMRNLFKKFGFQGLIAAASLVVPLSVFAQAPTLPNSGITNPENLITKLCGLMGWLFTFIVVFAILAILIAAFRYVTANGDQEAVEGANKALVYAAVAVALAVVAKAVPYVVIGFLSNDSVAPKC